MQYVGLLTPLSHSSPSCGRARGSLSSTLNSFLGSCELKRSSTQQIPSIKSSQRTEFMQSATVREKKIIICYWPGCEIEGFWAGGVSGAGHHSLGFSCSSRRISITSNVTADWLTRFLVEAVDGPSAQLASPEGVCVQAIPTSALNPFVFLLLPSCQQAALHLPCTWFN